MKYYTQLTTQEGEIRVCLEFPQKDEQQKKEEFWYRQQLLFRNVMEGTEE